MKERSAERRKRMVGNIARNFKEAEEWDLDFWQSLTPQQRLSALPGMHREVEMIEKSRGRRAGKGVRES